MGSNNFTYAKPIWPIYKEKEMNMAVGLRAIVERRNHNNVMLRVATSGIYKCFVNGVFIGFGPARAAKGYFRIDEWEITKYLVEEKNVVAIEACGYNANSFYIMDQTSFVQAEIVEDNIVIAATTSNNRNFQAFIIKEKIQKVDRYSFQRTFTEVYNLKDGYDLWKKDPFMEVEEEICSEIYGTTTIERRVPYPRFNINAPLKNIARGSIKIVKPNEYWEPRFIKSIDDIFKGFKMDGVEVSLSRENEELVSENIIYDEKSYISEETIIESENFRIFDFGINFTGFLGATVECSQDTKVYFVFDEILKDGDVDYKRLSCINGVLWSLKKGSYKIETLEPYTLKYLKIIALGGSITLEGLYLRDYCNPTSNSAVFKCNDEELNKIFEAGKETFIQNAVDIYTDCPSRERAGWLCDSFFTARVEKWLTGKSLVEKNFLENYLIAKKFDFLPEGMLPMCYPADHNDEAFIANWALWFVLELEEYLKRTDDAELVNGLRDRVLSLFNYFEKFRNKDGLLESLESWVFIEWSKANEFVKDVNYPTNMLYAYAMDIAGRLYKINSFEDESRRIKEIIRQQAFNGEFFVDNAVRENGKLKIMNNCTEVCQYYAFFFDIATPKTHSKLWNTLVKDFGPERKQTKKYEEIHYANAFIGNYLRLNLLSRYGEKSRLLQELKGYFAYMADKTGTLWENDGDYASCNHGFASHVVHHFYKDAAGIESIDYKNKVIEICINDTELENCSIKIPIENCIFKLHWYIENGKIYMSMNKLNDYKVNVINNTKMNLILQ